MCYILVFRLMAMEEDTVRYHRCYHNPVACF